VTPTAGQSGIATITVTVSDAGALTATDTFTITVQPPPNIPPTISDIGDQSVANGQPTSAIPFTIGDAETAAAALTLTRGTSNSTLVPIGNIAFGGSGANRTVTVTPVAGQSGTATITVTVTDGGSLSASDTFTITVDPPTTPPTILDITNQTVAFGQPTAAIPFTIGDTETAAAALTLTRGSSNTTLIPVGNIVFGGSGSNRTITVTPAAGQSGTSTITVTVTDGGSLTASDTFTITVQPPPNTPPTISNIGDQAITTGQSTGGLPFVIGDSETPVGALLLTRGTSNPSLVPIGNIVFGGSGANRIVTVTPSAGQTGIATITVTVTVTDGGSLTASDTFTITVSPPANTPPTISNIGDQTVAFGQPTTAVPFIVGDAETPAAALTLFAGSSNALLAPVGNITFAGSGANRTVTVTPASGQFGTATITVTVTDAGAFLATDTFVLTVQPATSPPPPTTIPPTVPPPTTVPPTVPSPPTVPPPITVPPPPTIPTPPPLETRRKVEQFAVATDLGSGGRVRMLNADQSERFSITPFPGFTGGVRAASADFNNDGIADLVVGTGPGVATAVRVLDGVTQQELFRTSPFEASFVGGVFVAAGDVTGDAIADLIITPDEGGGPRVRVFSGDGFGLVADFLGIDDPNFRGGARTAIGDLNGDGTGDLIVAAGFGGGPRVAGFDGTTLANSTRRKLFGDFLAFEEGLRNGIFVAAGDLDGDGKAELIAGGGPGGGPRVSSFDGNSLVSGSPPRRDVDFFAGDSNNRGGVRVTAKSLDDDARDDLIVGAGTGAGSRVTAYAGKTLGTSATPPELFGLDGFPSFTGGVFVG